MHDLLFLQSLYIFLSQYSRISELSKDATAASQRFFRNASPFNIWQCAMTQECAETGGGPFLSSLTDSICDLT